MDNRKMPYKARILVAEAMTDRRVSDVLSRMFAQKYQLFEQSVNTAYLAAQIADVTNYAGDVFELVTAALVHDTGMLEVPDEIFTKESRLTQDEKDIVARHARNGAQALSVLGFTGTVLDVARLHHERSDGSGYPNGLASPAIPRAAKIIMVCDVYEALTSDRPQRKAFNMYEAVSMMAAMPLSGATLQAIKRCDDP